MQHSASDNIIIVTLFTEEKRGRMVLPVFSRKLVFGAHLRFTFFFPLVGTVTLMVYFELHVATARLSSKL